MVIRVKEPVCPRRVVFGNKQKQRFAQKTADKSALKNNASLKKMPTNGLALKSLGHSSVLPSLKASFLIPELINLHPSG